MKPNVVDSLGPIMHHSCRVCGGKLYIRGVCTIYCPDCEKATKDKPFVRMQLLQDIEDSKRVDNE
ncbi:hypothetical protein [Pseudomonas phage Kat]|uniref:Uncharacterized protein n=1 Tax=Pseudomonas phage vB_Pae_Kat TaxID=2937408 RepID=A0A9E7DQ38_9CAUD|nr:hypothetical protein QE330_gp084 [Pseudomonas phage vB_Pae_Kat]UQS93522.1 hypothetical protein Kat_gp114 [Pseudomonas phage vB_Pae_Kat]WNV48880.1 hypothetical protein [Pseudomonas phage Kat]